MVALVRVCHFKLLIILLARTSCLSAISFIFINAINDLGFFDFVVPQLTPRMMRKAQRQ